MSADGDFERQCDWVREILPGLLADPNLDVIEVLDTAKRFLEAEDGLRMATLFGDDDGPGWQRKADTARTLRELLRAWAS